LTCAIVFLSARHCPSQCLLLVLGLIKQTWHCNFVSTFTMALCQTHQTFGPSKCITNVDNFFKKLPWYFTIFCSLLYNKGNL
jgi:hypothetical protein